MFLFELFRYNKLKLDIIFKSQRWCSSQKRNVYLLDNNKIIIVNNKNIVNKYKLLLLDNR